MSVTVGEEKQHGLQDLCCLGFCQGTFCGQEALHVAPRTELLDEVEALRVLEDAVQLNGISAVPQLLPHVDFCQQLLVAAFEMFVFGQILDSHVLACNLVYASVHGGVRALTQQFCKRVPRIQFSLAWQAFQTRRQVGWCSCHCTSCNPTAGYTCAIAQRKALLDGGCVQHGYSSVCDSSKCTRNATPGSVPRASCRAMASVLDRQIRPQATV